MGIAGTPPSTFLLPETGRDVAEIFFSWGNMRNILKARNSLHIQYDLFQEVGGLNAHFTPNNNNNNISSIEMEMENALLIPILIPIKTV